MVVKEMCWCRGGDDAAKYQARATVPPRPRESASVCIFPNKPSSLAAGKTLSLVSKLLARIHLILEEQPPGYHKVDNY